MGLNAPSTPPEGSAAGTEVSAVSPNWITTKLDFLTNWSRKNSLPQNIPLVLGKDRQEPGHRPVERPAIFRG